MPAWFCPNYGRGVANAGTIALKAHQLRDALKDESLAGGIGFRG
jgi:hypothetical protein